MKGSPEVSLVWQVKKSRLWEGDWVKEVLSHIQYKEIIDRKCRVYRDRSIIVIQTREDMEPYRLYFERLKEKGCRFGVILLSDETNIVDPSLFQDASFVLRNYWNKHFCKSKNTVIFPLGYKSGFTHQKRKKTAKELVWSFAGHLDKSSRKKMFEVMQKIPGHQVFQTSSFNDPKALKVDAYRALLEKSIFVPCPRGWWNLDSFRVYEALECGCIPIVEKGPIDYFALFFQNHPFITVSDWQEAPQMIEELLQDPQKLLERQKQCRDWWQVYKVKMKEEISSLIHKQFAL